MFMFTYDYPADNTAITIALCVVLFVGVIGLGFIIWEFFRK